MASTSKSKWQKYVANKPPEWYVWRGIKKRCYYTSHPAYYRYGGKGITVCDRWREHGTGFANFLEDMGPRPGDNYDLDRIDPDKGYYKENCRWLESKHNRGKTRRWIETPEPTKQEAPF